MVRDSYLLEDSVEHAVVEDGDYEGLVDVLPNSVLVDCDNCSL